MASSPADSYPPERGPLATAITVLAGTPHHSSGMVTLLTRIAKLATERVAAASYASVTALRGRAWTTVAVSDDLIRSVDAAQYADGAGPCLEALDTGGPLGVPDIDAAVQWPEFHEVAPRMGLHTSVSVPLFAGPGEVVAALNVYGHDRMAMAPLIEAICAVHERPRPEPDHESFLFELDAGGRELATGYAEALSIRATVQLAIELIRRDNHCSAQDAYLSLCIQAGAAGIDLAEAATTVIGHR